MRTVCLALALALGCPSSSLAEDTGATCRTKPSDAERLACYDNVFKKDAAPKQKPAETEFDALLREKLAGGNWQLTESKSKIDDSPTVVLKTTSLATALNRYGQPKSLYMIIRCDEGKTSAYISFAEHFMADLNGGGRVDYRVDDRKAKAKNFEESNDHEVLGLWSGGSSIPWIKELFGAKTLFVRATPYSSSEVSGEFPISGIEGAIKPLRAACKW